MKCLISLMFKDPANAIKNPWLVPGFFLCACKQNDKKKLGLRAFLALIFHPFRQPSCYFPPIPTCAFPPSSPSGWQHLTDLLNSFNV